MARAGEQGGWGLTCGRGGQVALRWGGLVALESLGERQANTRQEEWTEGLHGEPAGSRDRLRGRPATPLPCPGGNRV